MKSILWRSTTSSKASHSRRSDVNILFETVCELFEFTDDVSTAIFPTVCRRRRSTSVPSTFTCNTTSDESAADLLNRKI